MSASLRDAMIEMRARVLLCCISGMMFGCNGSTSSAPADGGTNCARAASHLVSCGVTNSSRTCDSTTPDVECEAACDLDTSCAYLLGQNPAEGRARAQCGSRCTCESAKRRAVDCGVVADFDCALVCNCPYSSSCGDGIAQYISCRAACPPWPEPTDAGDVIDAATN